MASDFLCYLLAHISVDGYKYEGGKEILKTTVHDCNEISKGWYTFLYERMGTLPDRRLRHADNALHAG